MRRVVVGKHQARHVGRRHGRRDIFTHRQCQQLFAGQQHRLGVERRLPVSPFQPGGSLMGTLPCSLARTAIRPSGTTVSDGAVPTNHHTSTQQFVKAFMYGVCLCACARAVMQYACAYRWYSRTEWPHSSTLSSWSPGPPVVWWQHTPVGQGLKRVGPSAVVAVNRTVSSGARSFRDSASS